MSQLDLLQRFYAAFAARDGEGMAGCYHPEARFSDPVFSDLRGDEVGAMWRMLTGRGVDLVVRSSDLWVDGNRGGARQGGGRIVRSDPFIEQEAVELAQRRALARDGSRRPASYRQLPELRALATPP